MCYNVSALYADDDASIAAASDPVVLGQTGTPTKQLNEYSEKDVYEKFIQFQDYEKTKDAQNAYAIEEADWMMKEAVYDKLRS